MEPPKTHFLKKQDMGKQLMLKQELIDYLLKMPEKGMGFHKVDITLKNGALLKDRIVFNSSYLQLNESEDVNNEDFVSIKISK